MNDMMFIFEGLTFCFKLMLCFVCHAHPPNLRSAMPTPAVTNTVPVPNNSQGKNREPKPTRPNR